MIVEFHDVYSKDLRIVGQVKYDGYRKSHRWTALNENGRIKDCETRDEAEELIRQADEGAPVMKNYVDMMGEVQDSIKEARAQLKILRDQKRQSLAFCFLLARALDTVTRDRPDAAREIRLIVPDDWRTLVKTLTGHDVDEAW